MNAVRILIKGTVQGVGFRPFVYRLAKAHGIKGQVANTAAGVKIHAAGKGAELERFLTRLRNDFPPLAMIDSFAVEAAEEPANPDFQIVESSGEERIEAILPPDMSVCADCRRELFDPGNRRYHYVLNNCTNCGPRYSIIRRLPYDRVQTAMAPFPFCPACHKEYRDPLDRRFHAEATSCPLCGPQLQLTDAAGQVLDVDQPLVWLAERIRQGRIVAVQGLGGFHIICDALNEATVRELRRRKQRPDKPFAVMVKDAAMAEEYGCFDELSRGLLESPQRPVVIVPERRPCSPAVNGGLTRVGLFLPYTPLHLLLFEVFAGPLVATSANIAEEPIITDTETLRSRLGGVIDYCLEFERKIINGCDDSVVTTVRDRRLLLRRARGYAPAAIRLPRTLAQPVLAVGGDMKNTLAIAYHDQVILSPHVGDLRTLGAQQYFERTLETFQRLYDFQPERIVCDAHPDYFTSRWAGRQNLPLLRVQHHYAHALAVMTDCELDLEQSMPAICWDGTGYGDDGSLWGGEFLLCSRSGYERLLHFRPLPLLGGEKAILEPRRVALGLLFQHYGQDALNLTSPVLAAMTPDMAATLYQLYEKGLQAPLSSSVGRLFDAAASLLGLCQILSYEGQSGLLLENYYDPGCHDFYPFTCEDGCIDCSEAVTGLLRETDPRRGASRFINMLAEIALQVMSRLQQSEAVVCGGVFQNRCLLERLLQRAKEDGLRLHLPTRVPVNDGAIALGQVAAALLDEGGGRTL